MGGVAGYRGLWGFVRGGMGAVAEAMAASARAAGATMRTNAPVAKVLVRGGRAYGVVLESGEEMEARAIVSNLALNALPEFVAHPGAPGPHHRATMHICPSIDYVERAWDDAKYGRPSERPLLELTIPAMYDPSLAPPGKHIMGIFLEYAPYTLHSGTDTSVRAAQGPKWAPPCLGTRVSGPCQGTWDDLREPFADRVIALIEEYAPNIRNIIEHRQVLTPLDLERRFGITGGNIFHGEMSLDQMFVMRPVAGWARYRTPIRGLYLCGSGAHPGGGVMGAPGYNCAREMLKEV
jgi:phytoene dehydrogenase-like protein